MDPVSQILIAKALDGLSMRGMATARNIANANSPQYRPVSVNFEDALQAAARQGVQAVRDLVPQVTTAKAGDLRIDLELATASETALRYAALVDLLGRQLQITRTVIRGGQ